MDLAVIIIVVLIGAIIADLLSGKPQEVKIVCRLHDWVTDEQTYKLVCCRCGKIAGQDNESQ